MERSDVFDAMKKLKLYGMRAAYDEVLSTAIKRQHEPQQIIGELLTAEIREVRGQPATGSRAAPNGAVDQIPDDHRQATPGQGEPDKQSIQ